KFRGSVIVGGISPHVYVIFSITIDLPSKSALRGISQLQNDLAAVSRDSRQCAYFLGQAAKSCCCLHGWIEGNTAIHQSR
ncbi:hypothetical protein OESDEN_23331, partial [Oesophagostomum dentatum]